MSKRTFFYFNAPLSGSREDLLNDGFQCFADIRQAANGFHACGFQSSEFLIRSTFTTGNDGTRVAHTFAFRRSHTSDVTHNWLGDVLFDVRSRFFFSATADLTDHDDRFGLRIFFEHFENIDKVRARDRVAADTNTGRLTETVIRGLFNRFIGQRTGTGNDTHFTWFVNVTRLDTFTIALPVQVRPVYQLWRDGQTLQLQLSEERSRYSKLQQSTDSELDTLRQQQQHLRTQLDTTTRKLENLTDIERQLSSRKYQPGSASAAPDSDTQKQEDVKHDEP